MSGTWSHLTCPPQPPFPIRISDDVFLPAPLRASSSEPSLNFELKGLKVLAKDEGEKEVVKVSEIKMRRRNTLLMTPGEVHRLGTLAVSIVPSHQTHGSTETRRTNIPKTPQPQLRKRRKPSDMSTPSSSDYHSDDSEGEYDTCSSSFSTPCSSLRGINAKYQNADQCISPCPSQASSKFLNPSSILIHPGDERGTFGQRRGSSKIVIDGLPSVKEKDTDMSTKFNFWRSPKKAEEVHSSPYEESRSKRRRISQIEWEGLSCPEEMVSPKTRQRVSELGNEFRWTSLH
ncbi:hypothetical protein I302_100203 [Kwoniella bestiolae CBS 10118]|uniref:Uncharacterized protein n=1 Tax=Kwoniella bestiolae CBS 10118 TaxID=1296100 RepID=A0A1B9G4H9_9TREE|nr:hypothetical protein I302_03576 [Kwoniella bestiolae CBS 10118]OCF25900.1 hypothetical protein I302_03576 [Kwoniella bestiolae CBS 10118]